MLLVASVLSLNVGAANAAEPSAPGQPAVQALSATAGGVVAAAPAPVPVPTPGTAPSLVRPLENSGQYYYQCIFTSGTSYTWAAGSVRNCPGWLNVYIGGTLIAHVNERVINGVIHPTVECYWAAANAVVGLVIGAEVPVGWVLIASDLALAGFTCHN